MATGIEPSSAIYARIAVSLRGHGGDRAGRLVPEGGGDVVEVHQALDMLGREIERLAGGIADALRGGDDVASPRLDQEGEGQAPRHVGVEVAAGGADNAKTSGGCGLRGGKYGGGDGADFDAEAPRQVELTLDPTLADCGLRQRNRSQANCPGGT
jgi:hypothetical protein